MVFQTVSPLSLLKNPMILMAVVALVLTFGMPKLMENSTFFLFFFFRPLSLSPKRKHSTNHLSLLQNSGP